MPDWLRLSIGTLTALPVPAPRRIDGRVARLAMLTAPGIGVVLGLIAGAIGAVSAGTTQLRALLAAAIAVGALAVMTRALHLDGLADLADSYGVRGDRTRRLEVMRQPTVGAFGVCAIVFVVALQVIALAVGIAGGRGVVVTVAAVTTSRLAVPLGCSGWASARVDGLGAAVARSVPGWVAVIEVIGVATLVVVVADHFGVAVVASLTALAVAVTSALVVYLGALRLLGGVTGDVLGAAVEISCATSLLTLALSS